jgi:predicted ribosome quality control (RQC) complex YloA/Tae2 family protein
LPAKQDKISPYSDGFIDYITAFNGGDVASYLFNGVSGFAYSTATELCVKFFGKTTVETVSKDRLTDFANYIITTVNSPKITPTVKVAENTVIDFFAFDYSTVAGESKTFDSVLSAQSYFYSVKENSAKLKMQENKLLQSLNAYEKKLKKRLSLIEEKERDCANIEDLKIKGELLIAYAYKIPFGVSEVVLENYYNDNKPIKISLDKTLKPTANAEKYFKRYAKQKRTLDAISPQKEEVLLELDYLSSVLEEIKLCENFEDYSFVERELIETGIIKKELPKKNKREKESNREYNIDGFTVFVGRNNAENDRLVKDARGKDIWFHAKKYHSSHAIVCIREKPITQKVVYAVAEIVAYYSAGRGGTKIEVDYTEKRFVKKPPKAKSGFVIYSDFKSVTVNPLKHEEFLKSK